MLEKFKKEKKLALIALILLGLLILSIIIGLSIPKNTSASATLPTTATTTAAATTVAPTTAATTAPATTAATTAAASVPVELALDNGIMTAYRNGAIAEDVNGIVYNKLDDTWYYLQGQILMAMRQYETAHQSFREAVRRDPDNLRYRQGALDAALAMKRNKDLPHKFAGWVKDKLNKR